MKYPILPIRATSRQMVDVFRGYNHNLRIEDGEFYEMENLTADHYPVLSPRGRRGVYGSPADPQGLIEKDSLCYVDGTDFVINGYPVDMGLSVSPEDCPKQLVSMGAYVIILPDKKWINTLDITEYGNIDASVKTTTDVVFSLCAIGGEEYKYPTVSSGEPKEPENMALWIDTSSTPHVLKQYSAASGTWVSIATTYIKISASGIGKAFSQYDGVILSGIVEDTLQELNGTAVIWSRGDDHIVVTGILDVTTTQLASEGAITVSRKMPDMDYVVEANNRLWGCRYGMAANGTAVNEIYASKLGDFKNWNCFMGISTDSWVGSVGTDGPFTGAVTHLGYPLFFKENVLHKVYISDVGAHGIQDTACRGVQRGCHKSLAIVNETLFYKARSGICAYDGSLPTESSYALGNEVYSEAVAGSIGNKYYVCMKDTDGKNQLFVLDTAKGMWHKESGFDASAFCACRGELYAIDRGSNKIVTMLGSGTQEELSVKWMAQTGEIGIGSPDRKYISRLNIRMQLDIGADLQVYAQYERDERWVQLCNLRGTSLNSFSLPVRPRRCDHMKLRFVGEGNGKIFSITKTIEEGSDRA